MDRIVELDRLLETLPRADEMLVAANRYQASGETEAALQVLAETRRRYPKFARGYIRASQILLDSRQFDQARALLNEAADQCPDEPSLLREAATLELICGNWPEAIRQWLLVAAAAPDDAAAQVNLYRSLRNSGETRKADQLLTELLARFPNDRVVAVEYGRSLNLSRSWERAREYWNSLRLRFPEEPAAIANAARACRETGCLEEADVLLTEAVARFPRDVEVLMERAFLADRRKDWAASVSHWNAVRSLSPIHILAHQREIEALIALGHLDRAAALADEAVRRLPEHPIVIGLPGRVASARGDWSTAYKLWMAAHERFPERREFSGQAFNARNRLVELDHSFVDTALQTPPSIVANEMYGIMMAFESLGNGCEFGSVQRRYGAEPLGLLRWSSILVGPLVAMLDAQCEGIGDPDNTEVVLEPNGDRDEYWISDRRYGMNMHTFIGSDEVSHDKIFVQSCRRLKYLSRKLLDDLHEGNKFFVYRLGHRWITDEEAIMLLAALRRHNDGARLLCVRLASDQLQAGTIEAYYDNLLFAYIDYHAGLQPDGRMAEPSSPLTNSTAL